MKKTIFYFLLAIAAYLVFSILKNIAFDFEQFTSYTKGFLAGQILLLVLLIFVLLKIKSADKNF